MSLNIQTEVNLDMTVRITGRDQVTGADLLKLNALFKAVEDMGGTITLPNPIPANPNFINCTYDANVLSYIGGTVNLGGDDVAGLLSAMNFPVGAVATFELNKTSHEQMFLSFGSETAQAQNDRNDALTISYFSPAALTLNISKQGYDLASVRLDEIVAYKIVATRPTETIVLLNFYNPADELIGTYEETNIDASRLWLGVALASQEAVFTANIQVATQAET